MRTNNLNLDQLDNLLSYVNKSRNTPSDPTAMYITDEFPGSIEHLERALNEKVKPMNLRVKVLDGSYTLDGNSDEISWDINIKYKLNSVDKKMSPVINTTNIFITIPYSHTWEEVFYSNKTGTNQKTK